MLEECCQGIHHMDEWISVGFLTRHEVAGRETDKRKQKWDTALIDRLVQNHLEFKSQSKSWLTKWIVWILILFSCTLNRHNTWNAR